MNIKQVTTRKAWSDSDVRQMLDLYFSFLLKQQQNIKYVKAGDVRALAEYQGRSKGSIEAKMMNTSAVLQSLSREWVSGYKPLPNYNQQLVDQVTDYLAEYDLARVIVQALMNLDEPAKADSAVVRKEMRKPKSRLVEFAEHAIEIISKRKIEKLDGRNNGL